MTKQPSMDISVEEVDQDHRLNAIEKAVASLESQLSADKEVVKRLIERVQQPTNWIALIGTAVVSLGALITFVNLQTSPLINNQTRLIELHDKLEDRFFDAVKEMAMNEARTLQKIDDNKEADIERTRAMEDKRKEAWAANERELDRMRAEMKQIEDYEHQTVKK